MPFALVHDAPPIVTAVVPGRAEASCVAEAHTERFPGGRFIGVFAADDGDDPESVLAGLEPALAERIFTASSSPTAADGASLARRALDEWGHDQDLVFTVPRLHDAIEYAFAALGDPDRGWEGCGVLVAGSATTIAEARRSLSRILAGRAPGEL